jgi:hypothetical protein
VHAVTFRSEHLHPLILKRSKQSTILNVRWPDVISNILLWEKTGEKPIELQIKKTKMEVDRAYY